MLAKTKSSRGPTTRYYDSRRRRTNKLISVDVDAGCFKPYTQSTMQRNKLATLYPRLAGLVKDEENITLALNEEYVQMGESPRLSNGDTVALIPPISGG